MDEVFADSGYWIARTCPNDALHQKANLVAGQLGSRRIVTSEMVLVEFLNYMSKLGSQNRRLAVETVQDLYDNPRVEIVPVNSQQLWAAVDLYAGRPNLRWSLVDCISFMIMQEKRIRDALAYDHDFRQAGYRALLRDD